MANYQESAAVAAARKALEEYEAGKPAAYSSKYGDQIAALYDKINNREAFSYDPNQDATYKIMKDSFLRQGKQAMRDTMGQAAGLTGGYGSTYGQNAGQQAYQEYLTKINDAIPALEEKAYGRYKDRGTELEKRLSLAEQMEADAYGRYKDQLSQFMQERSFLNDQYLNERNYDYQKSRDTIADQRYADELAYSRGRDALADARYKTEWDYGVQRDAVADAQWQKEFDEQVRQYNASLAARSSSGGGGGKTPTTEESASPTVSGHRNDITPADYDVILSAAKSSETRLNKALEDMQWKYGLTNAECDAIKAAYMEYIPEKKNLAQQKAYNNTYNSQTGKYQGGAANATGYYTSGNMFG